MRLPEAFLRLPLDFDVQALARALQALPESAWRQHPQGFAGNSFLPLVAQDGDPEDEGLDGPMEPTPWLDRLPGVRDILKALGSPIGRVRVMRLAPEAEASEHVDLHPYWIQRLRVHVPLITSPQVDFYCGFEVRQMEAGSCWVFDTWRAHRVTNPGPRARSHLVIDTLPSPELLELLEAARRGEPSSAPRRAALVFEGQGPGRPDGALLTQLVSSLELPRSTPPQVVQRFQRATSALASDWSRLDQASPEQRAFVAARHLAELLPFRPLRLRNGVAPVELLADLLASDTPIEVGALESALVLVSPPRSGSTLLFELLAQAPHLYSIGGESHEVFEGLPQLAGAARGSNRLDAGDAEPELLEALRGRFFVRLRDREGRFSEPDQSLRVLEKTPKSCLRVPLLEPLFEGRARFLLLWREPREVLASMLAGWRSGAFQTYRLPGRREPWSFLLPPGWERQQGSLAALVAWQWEQALETARGDLAELPPERVGLLRYAELVAEPQACASRVCRWAGLDWDRSLSGPLPLSKNTLTPPSPEKWRAHEEELAPVLARVDRVATRFLGWAEGRWL